MLLVEQRHSNSNISKVEPTQVPDSLTPGIFANPFARAVPSLQDLGNTSNSYLRQKHLEHQKARPSFHQNASSGIIFRQHFCNTLLRVGQRSNAGVLCKPRKKDFLLHGQTPTLIPLGEEKSKGYHQVSKIMSRHLSSFSYPKFLEFFMFPSLLTEMTLESMQRSSTWLHRKADIWS